MHTLLVMHGVCLCVRAGAIITMGMASKPLWWDSYMHMYYVHMCGHGTHRKDNELQLPMDAGMLPVS